MCFIRKAGRTDGLPQPMQAPTAATCLRLFCGLRPCALVCRGAALALAGGCVGLSHSRRPSCLFGTEFGGSADATAALPLCRPIGAPLGGHPQRPSTAGMGPPAHSAAPPLRQRPQPPSARRPSTAARRPAPRAARPQPCADPGLSRTGHDHPMPASVCCRGRSGADHPMPASVCCVGLPPGNGRGDQWHYATEARSATMRPWISAFRGPDISVAGRVCIFMSLLLSLLWHGGSPLIRIGSPRSNLLVRSQILEFPR
jgi:hypothetical protein